MDGAKRYPSCEPRGDGYRAAPQLNETDAPGPLCEVRLKKGDVSIGLIGAVLTLGTAQDVTLLAR